MPRQYQRRPTHKPRNSYGLTLEHANQLLNEDRRLPPNEEEEDPQRERELIDFGTLEKSSTTKPRESYERKPNV